jgi:molybdate transport system substrate-binding protein
MRELRVAAAANLKFAFDEIAAEFEKTHDGIRVTVTYGSSGNFFAQLSNGAPFDLFLSADVDYPRKLVEKGLARREGLFVYAVGQIVVWVPERSSLDLHRDRLRAVADPAVRKIAIANPRHAPYGRAAEAALKKLGIFEQVQARLVFGENVEQAAQFVHSGAADAGILPLSLARAPALRDTGRHWPVPADAYPPIEQAGVILNAAKDRDAAEQLRDMLLGPEGRAILARHGYAIPGER